MAKSKEEQIFVGIDDKVIELTGAEKEAFIAEKEARTQRALLLENEFKAKQKAREDAIKKLAEVAKLTAEELASIL